MKQENSALDAYKNDLVSMVSHELRAPLTTIKATIRMVAACLPETTASDHQAMLSLALENIDRMNRMINQLQEMTKLEAGRFEVHRQRVELVTLVRDVAHSFEPLAAERCLRLLLDLVPSRVECFLDRDWMVQVLTNLLHNAIKFTPEGHVTLSLRETHDSVEVTIADTGPGFRAEDVPHVFSKFKRFGHPTRPEDQGSGLGLALTKRLVELQGGAIRLDSRPGEGARFAITIPRPSNDQIFKQETLRLLRRAQEMARSLSLAEVRIHNWGDLQAIFGNEASATILNYLESSLKGSLRDESDFVIQRPGALWLTVFSATKPEAQRVLQRLQRNIREDATKLAIRADIELDTRLYTYPDDGQSGQELLGLLGLPA
jgi:anti-sigma regulatory factor (Ser/Thr protein kinase)